jgi:medium-chain acyl-[acyl-carrier-protein] hydrolase
MFDAWAAAMPAAVAVHAVQLPGREDRYSEPLVHCVDRIVGCVADALDAACVRPVALFGHSLGAVLAFELARELRRRGKPTPVGLLVSSFRAPHLPDRQPPLRQLPATPLARELVQRYGASRQLLASSELMALMAPVIRADLALSETYAFTPERPLECVIVVYRGARDANVTEREARAWAAHTRGGFGLRVHPGTHHLPRERESAVLALVRHDVECMLGRM